MTRINVVPPSELSQGHLVAEYRELPRVFKQAKAAIDRGEKPDDRRNPREYKLGTGHVRFFYTRLMFLKKRQQDLIDEMLRRGYKPNYLNAPSIDDFPEEWCRDYQPTTAAIAINRARIKERS